MQTYDIAVVGLGMIGSAALRTLSAEATGLRVIGLGPAEPADLRTAPGPFATHYDHARITRIGDPDPIWATLAQRSIAAYPSLAAAGGQAFHHPDGHLRLTLSPDDPTLSAIEAQSLPLGAVLERLDHAELGARFPALTAPAGAVALYEGGAAGWINPRAMVAAQLNAAIQHGASLVRAAVTTLSRDGAGFALTTSGGQRVYAERVLVSADGYSEALLAPLLGHHLWMERRAHSVVFAEIDSAHVAALAGLPSLIWPLPAEASQPSVYATPPARYADGRFYLKIGGGLRTPTHLDDADTMRAWFQSPGNPVEIAALQAVLGEIMPSLAVRSWGSKPCMNSYTAHGRPYIATAIPGLGICTGGCGAAAKSSDAIGTLGARLLLHGNWHDPLPAEAFQLVWR